MQAKLKELEDSYAALHPAVRCAAGSAAGAAAGSNEAPKFFPGCDARPFVASCATSLEQLLREQSKIAETVFFLMTQRWTRPGEGRRSAATRRRFQILDNPTLPTFRSRPKRRRLVLLGFRVRRHRWLASIWIAAPRPGAAASPIVMSQDRERARGMVERRRSRSTPCSCCSARSLARSTRRGRASSSRRCGSPRCGSCRCRCSRRRARRVQSLHPAYGLDRVGAGRSP